MEATISNTDLSKFHKADIAKTFDVDKLFRDIFDTKPLKVSSEEDNVIYFQGFYRNLPLTLVIHGYTLSFTLDDSHVSYDNHQRGTLKTRLLDKNYGTDIFVRYCGGGNIDFYSRELKIFDL